MKTKLEKLSPTPSTLPAETRTLYVIASIKERVREIRHLIDWIYADDCDLKEAIERDGVSAMVIVELASVGSNWWLHIPKFSVAQLDPDAVINWAISHRDGEFESNLYCVTMASSIGPIFRGRLGDGSNATKPSRRPTLREIKISEPRVID